MKEKLNKTMEEDPTETAKFCKALTQIVKEMSHEQILSYGPVALYFAEHLNNEILNRMDENDEAEREQQEDESTAKYQAFQSSRPDPQ